MSRLFTVLSAGAQCIGFDLKVSGCVLALLLGAGTVAHAQIGQPTPEELTKTRHPPPPAGGDSATPVAASTDPHQIAGTWHLDRSQGLSGEDSFSAGNGGAKGSINTRVVCAPADGARVGLDGPLLLVQTSKQITWVAEEMHSIRRIYLNAQFTPQSEPNYLGESIGHWEGNALVVETRYLKSLPAGGRRIEHWTKSADGKMLELKLQDFDATGKPIGAGRDIHLLWAPTDRVLEWMCEDYNEEWLPGGKSYQDQVNK